MPPPSQTYFVVQTLYIQQSNSIVEDLGSILDLCPFLRILDSPHSILQMSAGQRILRFGCTPHLTKFCYALEDDYIGAFLDELEGSSGWRTRSESLASREVKLFHVLSLEMQSRLADIQRAFPEKTIEIM